MFRARKTRVKARESYPERFRRGAVRAKHFRILADEGGSGIGRTSRPRDNRARRADTGVAASSSGKASRMSTTRHMTETCASPRFQGADPAAQAPADQVPAYPLHRRLTTSGSAFSNACRWADRRIRRRARRKPLIVRTKRGIRAAFPPRRGGGAEHATEEESGDTCASIAKLGVRAPAGKGRAYAAGYTFASSGLVAKFSPTTGLISGFGSATFGAALGAIFQNLAALPPNPPGDRARARCWCGRRAAGSVA